MLNNHQPEWTKRTDILKISSTADNSTVKVIEKCTNFYFGTEKLPPKF